MKQIKKLTVTYEDGRTQTWEGEVGYVNVRSQESKKTKPYQLAVTAHMTLHPVELKKGV